MVQGLQILQCCRVNIEFFPSYLARTKPALQGT